ncbi:MAG: thioredoxin [uncultured bacterium]|nr:MAG: thioredoxin [uncultured bacterium]OGJ47500.1 MAG: thioredoxin [Candidatus Peregrinibacteria bacterium RIFOXYA2_FULL_41_18]OGJ49498.1 MAG: thioredoxin [Candidatus Peregrinibacteria bacterium RIFOXYB12_FULL_41_12]OGJ53559.1 MAG: thioredoxin [Candidatus Peregrinibacteria bacterium RIFOXYC2_FULL_41_22]OGJ54275.1 MAG: thioredoxin [Candidatus Peregrinibacteria bacterium RIFOXYB2_FULL_41_88]
MAQQFTDQNFQQAVLEASKTKPVLVDFYASWCGPCMIQGPIIEQLSDEIGEIAIVGKLNTEESQKTAYEYMVMSIPTLLIFRNGEIVEKFVGVQSKESLASFLKKHV